MRSTILSLPANRPVRDTCALDASPCDQAEAVVASFSEVLRLGHRWICLKQRRAAWPAPSVDRWYWDCRYYPGIAGWSWSILSGLAEYTPLQCDSERQCRNQILLLMAFFLLLARRFRISYVNSTRGRTFQGQNCRQNVSAFRKRRRGRFENTE